MVWNKIQEDDVWKLSLRLPLLSVAKRLKSGEVNPSIDYDDYFFFQSTMKEFFVNVMVYSLEHLCQKSLILSVYLYLYYLYTY